MSGYLMRLIMRTRASGAGQLMQPSVRSTSPVAERDQRIGMMGMEGFEFGESSFAEVASEAGLEQDDALQAPGLPSITAASPPEGVTVQRKMASPVARPTDLAHSIAPGSTAGGAPMEADMQPSRQEVGRSDVLLPSRARQKVTDHVKPSSPSTSITEQASVPQDAVPLSDPPMTGEPPVAPGTPSFSPERDGVAEVEWSVASLDGPRAPASSPGSAQTREAVRHFGRADVRARSAQRVRQVDTTRLEPSARTFAEPLELRPLDASMPTAGADESPRIVIGRINVEVVPPPAAPQVTTAPRPLTAASVSVIGPLSGGVHPNLHLSLRHR